MRYIYKQVLLYYYMNKQEAVQKIEKMIAEYDFTLDPVSIRYATELRNWIIRNRTKIGITQIIQVRGIHTDQPDLKILVDDVELEADIVVKSERFFNKWHSRKNVDIVFCCLPTHLVTSDIPILVLPLHIIDTRGERRTQWKEKNERVIIRKNTALRMDTTGLGASYDEIINSLLDSYEKEEKTNNGNTQII